MSALSEAERRGVPVLTGGLMIVIEESGLVNEFAFRYLEDQLDRVLAGDDVDDDAVADVFRAVITAARKAQVI